MAREQRSLSSHCPGATTRERREADVFSPGSFCGSRRHGVRAGKRGSIRDRSTAHGVTHRLGQSRERPASRRDAVDEQAAGPAGPAGYGFHAPSAVACHREDAQARAAVATLGRGPGRPRGWPSSRALRASAVTVGACKLPRPSRGRRPRVTRAMSPTWAGRRLCAPPPWPGRRARRGGRGRRRGRAARGAPLQPPSARGVTSGSPARLARGAVVSSGPFDVTGGRVHRPGHHLGLPARGGGRPASAHRSPGIGSSSAN